MYHELYIDVFFLVNFMMDYLLLLLVRRMLKCSDTHGNICIGSILGSFLTCVTVGLPIPCASVKYFIFHTIISFLMLKTGLVYMEQANIYADDWNVYSMDFTWGSI